MKKVNILVVGSFVMDLIVTTPRFPVAGETILGSDFNMASGGKGANQAVQAARLGANVTMVGCVGNDVNGKTMLECLKNDGIDVSHVVLHDTLPSAVGNVQIEAAADGSTQNRIIVVPGANFGLRAEHVSFLKEEISNYDFVIMQLEIPMEINMLVARYAHDAGVPVMLNPAPAAKIPAELLSNVNYISPNETELALLCGVEPFSDNDEEKIDSAKKYAELLRQDFGVENVLVTLGSSGALMLNNQGITRSLAVKCDPKDPTAAGDSYVGALCYALSIGLSTESAMNFAAATASITVSKMGAQPSLPFRSDVVELLESLGNHYLVKQVR